MLSRMKLYLCTLLCGVLVVMISMITSQRGASLLTSAGNNTESHPRAAPAATPKKRCECQSCVAEKGVSKWFDCRFDPKQKPFLTKNGHVDLNDSKALQWWLTLQSSADGLKSGDVIQKMFQVISTPSLAWISPAKACRTCAVVGNSGNLVGSGYGSQIDSHISVIRMNKAITTGYEEDVGGRTTHHLMYPESATDLAAGVHLVLLPFKLRDMQWVASALSTGEIKKTYMKVKERIKADKDKVVVLNPTFFNYVHEKWGERHGRYPSTGMMAIVFALHTCDQVSVFGFGADQYGNWHHYWENNRFASAFRKTGVHDADFEMLVIKKLNAEGKIRLVQK